MKKYVLIITALSLLTSGYAQEPTDDVRRFRIGLKVGVPNGLGGNAEYVLPFLDNHLAPFVDYSYLSADIDDVETSLNFFEIGTNIYFGNQGTGLYGSLSYGKLNLDGTYTDSYIENGEFIEEEGDAELDVSTFNIKVGAKLGRKFYFRGELGYGFGDIPQEVIVTGTRNGEPDTWVEEIPDIWGVGENGTLLLNIGVGYAF